MTAREWSAGIKPGASVRWRGLEVAAFQQHPKVVRVLDPKRKYARRKRSGLGAGRVALGFLTLVVVVVLYFPSVIGFAVLVGDRFNRSHPDPAVTLPIAGAIFVLAFVMLLITFIPWLRAGRQKEGANEVQAVTALVLGCISLYIAATRGSTAKVPNWQLWIIPMIITVVFAAVYLIMLLLARRQNTVRTVKAKLRGDKNTPQNSGGAHPAVEPLKAVRLAVEKLPADDLSAVKRDIDGAIDDLAVRGVITQDDAQWAHGAELGKLALRMSQPRPHS